nr:hypothetical protein BaRGS_033774 [Batillaria attramentaria]
MVLGHEASAVVSKLGPGVTSLKVDLDQSRLDFAKTMGADGVIKVTSRDPKETAAQVEEVLGEKADITIECSGAPPNTVELPVVNAAVREVDIVGIFRYVNCYPTALAMIASGKVNVKPMVTHRYSLEQALQAFEAAKRGEGVKIMISCGRK